MPKPKAIAPTEEVLLTEPPTPIEPPAPSSLLQSAIEQQDLELSELEAHMTELSERYAARARSIVLQGLENGRRKARAEILTIDIPSFFDSEGNGSPLPSAQNLALPDRIEEVATC
jgi:hypothetical protein